VKFINKHKNTAGKLVPEPFSISDFDDLVFEHRNREYGAYQLRKKYNRVLFAGILIATIIGSSVVILPHVINPRADKIISTGMGYYQVRMENLEPPIDKIFVPPVVVDTVLTMKESSITTDEALASEESEDIEVAGSGSGGESLLGQDGTETDEPFFLVEVMPSFRGGDLNKFREWVQKRTNYPQVAIDNRIQGRVFLTFIIEPDGSVTNVTVVKGVDPLIDNEAVKAIQASPKWSPGLQRGQPVRVRFQIWLTFMF